MGRHFVRYEPPDIAFWAFEGDLSEAEMRRLRGEIISQAEGLEYLLILVDFTRMGKPSAGARKVGTEKTPYDVRATAIFGASAPLRILANLVTKAHNLLTKRVDNPVRFFEAEAEARVWLQERRREIQQDNR